MIEIKDVSFTYNQAEASSLSRVSLSIRERKSLTTRFGELMKKLVEEKQQSMV